jgi:hypothetical protein
LLDFLSQQENFHIKNDRHPYHSTTTTAVQLS